MSNIDQNELSEWENYWNSQTFKRNLIELVRDKYFANMFAKVVKKINQKGKMLEAGCGSAKIIGRLRSEVFTVGCDYSKAAITSASKNCKASVVCDISNLPFKKGTFNLIFNQGVMEHFQEDEFISILREFKRVAQQVLILVPSKTSIFRIYNPWQEIGTRFYTKQQLNEIISRVFIRSWAKYLPQSFFLTVAGFGSD